MSLLTFLGAAGTVTGSKHLLEVDGHRILVDCGLFQGLKVLRQRNWEPLPVDPASIQAVVLTHAHLDHCGYLPRLVSGGFRGRIFCTPGTKELTGIVLRDSARLQEEDAKEANRHGYTRHNPALPLYTQIDAARAIDRLQPVGYDRAIPLWSAGRSGDGPSVEFVNAGHLLGSACARIRVGDKLIVFGGDLGRYGRPVLPDPMPVPEADYLLLESTYGDRLHISDETGEQLAGIVRETARRRGKLIVPAFAIGRVEELLYWLKRLEDEQRIPILPVFVDSPMAIAALQFYAARVNELDAEMTDTRRPHGAAARQVAAFATRRLVLVASPQQSADLIASRQPSIVISSSGMATGGRVLRHLAATLPDSKNTVLFVGYQSAGTRGRALVDGAKEVRMLGRSIPVAAQIERLDSMSAHADAGEIMRWLSGFSRPPRTIFLVHGEPIALDTLAARIRRERGWSVHVAVHRETIPLDF
jgi:metallo-beta-lactamase family protein